jgi:hypothetical protein
MAYELAVSATLNSRANRSAGLASNKRCSSQALFGCVFAANGGSVLAALQQPSDLWMLALLLRYFYDRNNSATSMMGKKGSAVRTSDLAVFFPFDIHGCSTTSSDH